MGGATLPTASTPGYGTITRNDHTYVGCDCLIAWLKAAERLGLASKLIRSNIDIVQLTGGAVASGGTHTQGGVFDVRQCTTAWVRLFREMGAAAWARVDVDDKIDGDPWENNEHTHGVIDCPHNDPADYQVTAYWRGYSGLGQATSGTYAGMWGYGSKDPDPWRPTVRRTWREGIAWADAQTASIIAALEDDMPTPAELWSVPFESPTDGVKYPASSWLVMANVKAGEARAIASKALAEVAALTAAFKALAANPKLTPEQVTAAAKAGAAAALDERITSADVTLTVDPA